MHSSPDLTDLSPFEPAVRGLTEPDPARARLREAGPLVKLTAPPGGPVWVVTEDALARRVLADPRIAKDPAFAPADWDPHRAGLEQTAAQQPSLTTLDGPEHAKLRRAHAPLLSAKRVRAQSARIHQIARELLTTLADEAPVVDLMADFTIRYPLTVLLDLLGIPLDLLDRATGACRLMFGDDPEDQVRAIGALSELAAAGLDGDSNGLAAQLRDRVPAGTTPQQLHYHLFGLIFAGQLTTDASLGFLVARVLRDVPADAAVEQDSVALVNATLREHPPAPFTLWRFTTTEIELAGMRLPARSPVLVDIQGINTGGEGSTGPDLTFGAGPHFCIGAQLAQLELAAVATVLRTDFPNARLTVPFERLQQLGHGGIQGIRLTELPIALRG